MTYQYPWAAPLGVSAEQIKAWEAELPPQEPLIAWVLKNNKIEEERLFAWSRQFYGLPALRHSFFQAPPQTELWGKTKELFVWTEQLIPLYEWDNTLFVGCLEPARNLDLQQPVQFILCHQQDLSLYWHQLQSREKPGEETPFSAEGGIDDKTVHVPLPTNSGTANFDQLAKELGVAENKNEAEAQSIPPAQETPDGFQPNLDLGALDFSSIAKDETAPPAHIESPTEKPKVRPAPPPTTQVEQKSSEQPPTPPAAEDEGREDYAFPEPPNRLRLEDVRTVEDLSALIFQHLGHYFVQQIIFINQDESFKPVRWTGNCQPSAMAGQAPLTIDKPNVFHIVHKSKQPFHGPISPNTLNDQFLKNWNNSQYPPGLTAYPIVDNGKVLAILVGLHEKKAHDLTALSYMDAFVPTLVPAFQHFKVLQAA